METNSHPQTNYLGSSGGQTSVVLEQSPCAFCRSSKQTKAGVQWRSLTKSFEGA
ncbi:hypothetical protein Hanom_Chr08g00757251 [Helianthus anomalus]